MRHNVEFFETVIHTDHSELPSLHDENAAQFIMKMAAIGATVEFVLTNRLFIKAKTPFGEYTFIFDADEDPDLVVEQIL